MLLESFLQDIRIGLRVLIKEKSFCALAVFILALGICAVTTQFSIVNGVVLRGFSFPHADRQISLNFIDPTQTNAFGTQGQISAMDYEELRPNQKSFEMLAAYLSGSTVNVTAGPVPQRYTGAYVTEDFLRIIGVAPILGRDFTAADNKPGAPKTAIISHLIWQRDFASSPDVIGRAVRINGAAATIIGVMPKGFNFPTNEELWVPLFAEFPPRPRNDTRAISPAVIGLIKPGVTIDQAALEFGAFAKQFAAAYPDTNKQFATAEIETLRAAFTPNFIKNLMFGMLAICVLVLLIACINVMNMQFARATLRAKELAVRSSLGASRIRLIRQMLTESLLVAALGAVIGVAGSYWAVDFLSAVVRNLDQPPPSWITFDIDGVVLGFTVIATGVAAVVAGFVPAWMSSRANAAEALKEGGRGNTSRTINFLTRGLVIVQIMMTSFILVVSLLLAHSMRAQQTLDYGYDTEGVMTARMGLMDGEYPTPDARKVFYERLLRELGTSPEFAEVALTNRIRMTFVFSPPARTEIEGRTYPTDKDRPNVIVENISSAYFAALGIRILEGRAFTGDDLDTKQPVAIISAGFAKKFFGNESPVGRRLRTVANNGQLFGPWRTIVGVSANTRMSGPINFPNVEEFGYFLPIFAPVFGPVQTAPGAPQFCTVVVRPRGQTPASTLVSALQREVKKVNPNQPVYFVGTPKVNQAAFTAQNQIIIIMVGLFGVVAVVLASVGLYGIMSFSVNQRTQEFGVRMALGADAQRILRMVINQGAAQLVIGLGLGLGLTGALGFFGRSAIEASGQLFRTNPTDPITYFAVALLLVVVGFIATLVPARRATRVDPMIALRAE